MDCFETHKILVQSNSFAEIIVNKSLKIVQIHYSTCILHNNYMYNNYIGFRTAVRIGINCWLPSLQENFNLPIFLTKLLIFKTKIL